MMRIDSEPMTIPVIALRGLTVFPNVLIHFEVTRETSVRALEAAMSEGTPIFLVAQRDMMVEGPEAGQGPSPTSVRFSACLGTTCG